MRNEVAGVMLLFICLSSSVECNEASQEGKRLQHKLRLFEKNVLENVADDKYAANEITSMPKGINGDFFPILLFKSSLIDSTIELVECGISKHNRQRKPRQSEDGERQVIEITANSSISGANRRGKIINGKESKPGAWPWQVNVSISKYTSCPVNNALKKKSTK